jgi:uroporphyrin-III C-methyltransferase / precorrin-2 dehydrogenase / sirohydrochlorin ferrochelatase
MAGTEQANLYPLFLKLAGRTVLVVGAGAVAERKIATLLASGARVKVVAPRATDRIQQLANERAIDWVARPFEEADAQGMWLMIAATSDREVQSRAAAAAEGHRVFVVAVDDPGNATAYSGAVVRRPPITMAISSSGATPALTRLLREIVEQLLPSDEWVEHAKELRARWLAAGTPQSDRFAELVKALKQRA